LRLLRLLLLMDVSILSLKPLPNLCIAALDVYAIRGDAGGWNTACCGDDVPTVDAPSTLAGSVAGPSETTGRLT